jgi:hypothetical protein
MLKISPFGGLLPRLGSRLLPDSGAQTANNMTLKSGEIRPLREPALVNVPNKELPALTIYSARNSEDSAWFSWPFDVDVVRVPLPAEVESRFVWTGDGIPKITTYSDATTGGTNDYPNTGYALGIPAPIAAPAVAPAGGVGAATTRIYTYTFFSELGEESAPAPASALTTGKVDDTWAITGMAALPPNSGDITNITYVGKSVTITTSNTHYNRAGESVTIENVTTVTNVNGTWKLTAANPAAKTMTFTVADTPAGAYNNATDTTDTWARTVEFNTAGMKRRLYRSTGNTGTVQLVHDDVGTTYNDTLSDANIMGDELISSGWAQPRVGLQGVKVHPSGALIGFVGNILCMSEPYQPHAWPAAYELATDRDIVGVSIFGSDIGVGTKGNPWIASGVEPASMSFEKIPGMYPCLSKRSLIGYGDGLIYATAHGLVYASRAGVSIMTDQFYDKADWQELNPASMMCAAAYGRLYISFQRLDESRSMIIIDGDLMISADVTIHALYSDESSGELYISDSDGIKAWDDADSYPLSASWQSKDFVLPAPVNMGAAKIEFDIAIDPATQAAILAAIEAAETANAALLASGNIRGSMNSFAYNGNEVHATSLQNIPDNPPSNLINFILRKNGNEIVISRMVSNNKAFRLPSGYKADTFSVEVFSQCRIKEIRIAETMDGLRGA